MIGRPRFGIPLALCSLSILGSALAQAQPCRVWGAAVVEVPPTERRPEAVWWGENGTQLLCDLAGYEPLDIVADRSGRRTDRLFPARILTLQVPIEWTKIGSVRVEWRRPAALGEGNGSPLLATREAHALRAQTSIFVARRERLIRLRAGDRAPVTLYLPAGQSDLTLHVDPPESGGQVVLQLGGQGYIELEDDRGGPVEVLAFREGRNFGLLPARTAAELMDLGWTGRNLAGLGFGLPPDQAFSTPEGEVVSGVMFFADRHDDVARVLLAVRIPTAAAENRHWQDDKKLRYKVVDTYNLRIGEKAVVEWLQRVGFRETVRLEAVAAERWAPIEAEREASPR